MKQKFLLALIVLITVSAHAAGRQEASEVCASIGFDSHKQKCISNIAQFEYFDQGAIDVCKGMDFDSNKAECVLNIGNKSYDAYETAHCSSLSFDSKKNECLKKSGRPAELYPEPPFPPPGCLSNQEIVFELQRLDSMVYRGENLRARNLIYDLIVSLQRCP